MTRAIGMLVLEFHLPGCSSLKEKRGRLGGLRDRYGKQTNVAVCETDFADVLQRAEWTFIAIAQDAAQAASILQVVERDIETRVDAVISRRTREFDA